jgi:hypothetical protein
LAGSLTDSKEFGEGEVLPDPIPPDGWSDHGLWGDPGDRWWRPSTEWPDTDAGALPDAPDQGGFVEFGDPRHAPESQPDVTTLADDQVRAVLQILSSLRYTPGNGQVLAESQTVGSTEYQSSSNGSSVGAAAARDRAAGNRANSLASDFTDVVRDMAAGGEQSEGGMVVLLPDVLGSLSTASASQGDADQGLLETPARIGAARGRFQAFEVSTVEAAAESPAESGDSAAIPSAPRRGEWPGEVGDVPTSNGPKGSVDAPDGAVADFQPASTDPASDPGEPLLAALAEWRAHGGSVGEPLEQMAESGQPDLAGELPRRSPYLPFVALVMIGFVAMSAQNWGLVQSEGNPRLVVRRKT